MLPLDQTCNRNEVISALDWSQSYDENYSHLSKHVLKWKVPLADLITLLWIGILLTLLSGFLNRNLGHCLQFWCCVLCLPSSLTFSIPFKFGHLFYLAQLAVLGIDINDLLLAYLLYDYFACASKNHSWLTYAKNDGHTVGYLRAQNFLVGSRWAWKSTYPWLREICELV